MNNIKINRERVPQVIFPAQILDRKYIGELKGYYVEETNSYNILPFDSAANINHNKIYPVGFILPVNPFHFVDKDIASEIQYIKLEETTPDEIVKKMQEAMKNSNDEKSAKYFDADEYYREESNFIKEILPQINDNLEHNKYGVLKIDDDVANTAENTRLIIGELNRTLYCGIAEHWMKDVFVQVLYRQPDKRKILTGCNSRDYDAIVGYWEKEELHFVQLKNRKECKQDKYSLKLDVFSRNTGILESDIMLEKGAMFIGCGSVGSFFALELAKAGVGRFLLIDNDIFGYHNICRHQCGIYDVGRYKTDALAERILQVNPYAKVVTKNMIIQDVPVAELVEFCDKNTIVIGGADNREGDLYANNLAQQIEMPFMSIGCWERAFAGEIFYCLPKDMPNYLDFMKVSGLLSARVNQNRRFYTTEDDLKKVTFEPGISADINFVTIIAVKMALDILNIGNENYTQKLLPHLTQYTLVCNTNNKQIGGETAEIFSYPLQVSTSIIVSYSEK